MRVRYLGLAFVLYLVGCGDSGQESPNEGGATATGGATETGGAQSGGTGGMATGGTVTGGAPTGGAVTGGAPTGGAVTGGAPTCGTETGGAPTGGTETGGAETGGGGAETGGAETGGTETGGTETGGAQGTGGGGVVGSPGCGTDPSLQSGDNQQINVNGTNRSFNLDVPGDYDNSVPHKLIVAYHWLNGTANDVSNGGWVQPYYGLWDMAGGSTIFVAPQGEGNAWGNGGGVDVEFSRQLITLLEDEFCIDTSRIFCEGFSMGGSMSYAMACAMGDVIRAVAVHSGGSMSGCDQSNRNPVAYFMTHGTNDGVCTYPGYGVPQLEDFASLNGCTAQSMPTPTDGSGNTPECIDYANCDPDYPTRACIFVGDHTPVPGNNGWVATETWDFFSQF